MNLQEINQRRERARQALGAELKAITIDGPFDGTTKTQLAVLDRCVTFDDRAQAVDILALIISAYLVGERDSKRQVRNALGLSDCGGVIRVET